VARSLDRARWQRLSAILDRAIELPQERRARFVEEVCGGDQDLLTDVEELLTAAGAPDDFLASPAAEHVAPLIAGASLEARLASDRQTKGPATRSRRCPVPPAAPVIRQ
jgi:hypothetical protein